MATAGKRKKAPDSVVKRPVRTEWTAISEPPQRLHGVAIRVVITVAVEVGTEQPPIVLISYQVDRLLVPSGFKPNLVFESRALYDPQRRQQAIDYLLLRIKEEAEIDIPPSEMANKVGKAERIARAQLLRMMHASSPVKRWVMDQVRESSQPQGGG